MMHFWPRRPGARLNFGLTCPIFRSRTARDRIEILAAIAGAEDEKSDTRLRALKQIADETAADVEGMLAALQEQIDLLERQIYGIPNR